ncbi:hypothetical protein H8356DRAFT_933568, partial [Neocallimastix lanati (nom. inval.)]
KIKILETEKDDFKLYLDNFNSLFTEYNNEAKLQNKSELSEETKILDSLEELNKVEIYNMLCNIYKISISIFILFYMDEDSRE